MSYTLKSIAKYLLLTSIYVIYWILKKIIRVLYVTLKQTVKMIRRTKTVPPEHGTEFLAFYLGDDFNEPYDILGFGSHKGRIDNASVLQSRTPIYRCDVVSLRPTRERDENGSMMYEICKHNLKTPYVVHTKFSGHVIFARNIAVFYDGQSDHGFTKDFGRVLFEEGVMSHVKTDGRGIYIMLACWSMDKECFIVKENPKEPPKQITSEEVKEFERYRDYKPSTTSIPSLLDITINPVSENKNPFALAQSDYTVTEKENRIVENPQTNNEMYQHEQPEKTYTGIVCRIFENFQTGRKYYVVYNNEGCAVITPDSRPLSNFSLKLGSIVQFVPRRSRVVVLQEEYEFIVDKFDESTTLFRGTLSIHTHFLVVTVEVMYDQDNDRFFDYDECFRVYDVKRLIRAPSTKVIYTARLKNKWVSGEGVRWEIDCITERRQAPRPSPARQDRCDEEDYCMSRPPLQRVSLKSRFSAPKYQMTEVQTNIDRYESRREDRTGGGDTFGRDRDQYRGAPVEEGMKKLHINSNEERRTRDRRDRRSASIYTPSPSLPASHRLTQSLSTHMDKRMDEVNDDVKSLNKGNGKEEDSGIKVSPVVGNVAPSPTGSDGETKENVKKPSTSSTSATVPSPRPTPVHQPNQYGQYGRGGGGVPLWLQREQREHPTLEFLTAHQGTSEELLTIAFADPRRLACLKPGMFEKIMKTARKLDIIKKEKAEEKLASLSQ